MLAAAVIAIAKVTAKIVELNEMRWKSRFGIQFGAKQLEHSNFQQLIYNFIPKKKNRDIHTKKRRNEIKICLNSSP